VGNPHIFGGYQEEITIFSCLCLVNPNVLPVKYPSFSGENKPCLGGAGVALRGDLVGKNLPNGFMV
jgi:hypothetical protein